MKPDLMDLPEYIDTVNSWSQAYKDELFRAGLYMAAALLGAALLMRMTNRMRLKGRPRSHILAARVAYFLVLGAGLIASLHHLGLSYHFLLRGLLVLFLVVSALYMVLRPFVPSLPFRIGDIILASGIYGKVEAISFLHTRLRTFDGKTVFVPNGKILKDTLVNFHTTPNRRVDLEVTIRYQDDLGKAKELIRQVMEDDERVLKSPAPMVYVLKLADSGVHLGGRCWVPNLKYWRARCDLLETLKLRVDQEEGVSLAYPRQEVVLLGPGPESGPAPQA